MSNALARVPVQGVAVEVVDSHVESDGPRTVQWSDVERALAARVLTLMQEGANGGSGWTLPSGATFEGLFECWLEDRQGELDPGTIELYRMQFVAHLRPHFGAPQAITKAAIADYGRNRLRVVKRKTLQKERSTLRGFLSWCHEQGCLRDLPEFPELPRRAMGTPFRVRRRGKATELSPEECRAVIAALPRWSRPRGDKPSFPVRARFIVAYETALRPATLDALSVRSTTRAVRTSSSPQTRSTRPGSGARCR